jgi:hypothetical protein
MDAVENFVQAASDALDKGSMTGSPEPKRGTLRAIGDFLKSVFGPHEPETEVRVNGRPVNEEIAAVISALYANMVSARLRLDEARVACTAELVRRRRAEDLRRVIERHWALAERNLLSLTEAHFALCRRVAALYDALKHGDDDHKAWLKEALAAHFAGMPVPPPRKAKKAK